VAESPYLIQINADPMPLTYWAERWVLPVTTIKTWIANGTCPGRKIGGQWMISALDLFTKEAST